jgi:subtilase family serine protease
MLHSRRRPRSIRPIVTAVAVVTLPLAGLTDATPATASTAATTASTATVSGIRVYLEGADPQGLAAYATAVSTPGDADYQHYLTPQQYRARFGPTTAQTSAVEAWLTGAGLHITSANWHYITVSGDAAAVRSATVPADVASDMLTISGLTSTKAAATVSADAQPAPINVGPCSAYYGQKKADNLPPAYGTTLNWDLCGYTPAQLRSAYGVAGSGFTGRGTTVAVVDDGTAPTLEQDLDSYSRDNGLPSLRPGQFTQNLPSDIDSSCPAAPAYEASLDVESVHAMAPGADLVYVGADCSSMNDDLDAELRVVDGHLADIVSNSWHFGIEQQLPPDLITAFDRVMEQGVVEGIGFYFSAGDNGDWSTATPDHTPAVQYPASDPWVTSVGGTSLAVGRQGHYLWETGWGSMSTPLSADGSSWAGLPGTFTEGSGGGRSAVFSQPAYQAAVVPTALSTPSGAGSPMRVIPDIAADADPDTGILFGLTVTLAPGAAPEYAEGRAGGTSLSTPLIAGIQADAEQAEGGGRALGFANPALYQRYRSPEYRDVVADPLGPRTTIAMADESLSLTTGAATETAVTFGRDESLTAAPGYDDVTGLGTPTALYLDSYRRW